MIVTYKLLRIIIKILPKTPIGDFYLTRIYAMGKDERSIHMEPSIQEQIAACRLLASVQNENAITVEARRVIERWDAIQAIRVKQDADLQAKYPNHART